MSQYAQVFVAKGLAAQRAVDKVIFSREAERSESVDGNSLSAPAGAAAIASGAHAANERPTNPGRAQELAGQGPDHIRPRTLNPTCFINRSAVREFLLEHSAGTRAHRFERVSEATLVQINESVRNVCISVVRRLPSKGKTI